MTSVYEDDIPITPGFLSFRRRPESRDCDKPGCDDQAPHSNGSIWNHLPV